MNIIIGNPLFGDWDEGIKKLEKNDIIINDLNDVTYLPTGNSLIIPLTFDQMKFLINNKDKITSPILCCDDYNTIELLNNKCRFVKFMLDNKLDHLIPETYMIHHNNTLYEPNKIINYPVIYKFGITQGGYGSKVFHTNQELSKRINNSKYRDFIVQKYIEHPNEFSGHMFIKDGKIEHAIYYKVTNHDKYYIQNGKMQNYTRENNFQYQFNEIFKLLNYTGIVCIDFKIINNQIKIFEINPRFGGTLIHNTNDLNEMLNKIKDYYLSISPAILV